MKLHVFPTGFEVQLHFKRKYIHHAEQLFPRRLSDYYITMEAFQPAETVLADYKNAMATTGETHMSTSC